jgi:hypothetical protein
MRYFLRRRVPEFSRVLLIESGSREILEELLPRLYNNHPGMKADLITCYAGVPAGFDSSTGTVYRVTDYAGRDSRRQLYDKLSAKAYTIAIILCSGEPIMTKWKWMLGARLPVKVLVVNENVDYFWLDYSNWRTIRHFVLYRGGLTGAGAVSTIARLLLFPFTLFYLLLYTAIVHLRRKVSLRKLN